MLDGEIEIPIGLIDKIKGMPVHRSVSHCNKSFEVPIFDFYATCPECQTQFRVRAFSAIEGIENIFDAVFEWSLKPGADKAMRDRIKQVADDLDEE